MNLVFKILRLKVDGAQHDLKLKEEGCEQTVNTASVTCMKILKELWKSSCGDTWSLENTHSYV